MRKILSLILVSLFIAGVGVSFADSYAGKNYVDFSGRGGPTGVTPPTEVMRVRYGRMGGVGADSDGLKSGDVCCWDGISADGLTISGCIVEDAVSVAGILVEDIATSDSTKVTGSGDNWGYIAIKGFVHAKIDTDKCTTGMRLITAPIENDDDNWLETTELYQGTVTVGTVTVLSGDNIGVLLRDSGSDSVLAPVFLD